MSFSILKHIPEKPINENKLQEWLDARLNVMLVGNHGIGKTCKILEIFNKNYENRWAFFNGATCDPWTDLIGIPTAAMDKNGQKVLEFIKPAELSDDIEGIYIDEANHSKKSTISALLELVQFKSINGRKFPNLKVVWSSINPPKEDGEDNDDNFDYDVEELNPAFLDRFHIIVKLPSNPDLSYFTKHFDNIGINLIEWWNQQPKEAKALISPRRLEYIAQAHLKKLDITDFLPKCCNTKMLIKKINGSPTINKYYDLLEEKKQTTGIVKELHKLLNTENSFEELREIVIKENQWEMLDLLDNEEKIDIFYKNNSAEINNYFFNNFTTKGKLFEFLSKKIGNTERFQRHLKDSNNSLKLDVSRYEIYKEKNIGMPPNEEVFIDQISYYLTYGINLETISRRNCCDAIIRNFPQNMSLETFKIYIKFVNLLIEKIQLPDRVDEKHLDGKYVKMFTGLAMNGCRQMGIDYKNESFYKNIV